MLKRHMSIGVFVVYIDTGSSVPGVPSKSRDLADENNKIWTEWIRNNSIYRFFFFDFFFSKNVTFV
jgi:hypothetical protein